MRQLNSRQAHIQTYIFAQGVATNRDILAYFNARGIPISRATIARDLDVLLSQHHIKKEGEGRAVHYMPFSDNLILRSFDDSYFDTEIDQRHIQAHFNATILDHWQGLFSRSEHQELDQLTQIYRRNRHQLTPSAYRKEVERLTIELSWKSSQIEGNTYSLLETESLIKNHQMASGHSKEEAIMILNHKTTLDYIFAQSDLFQIASVRKIEDIHRLLVTDLGVGFGIRNRLVKITGTRYTPLDNAFQIREAIDAVCNVINKLPDPFSKALTALLWISYVQPFEDGNKRTARLVSDAILLGHDACPLSYRSVDVTAYKKAVLLFYEQNSLVFFKDLFIDQYRFAVKTYFAL